MLIDTHTHLTFPQLLGDLDAVLARAFEAGVTAFVIPGVDGESSASAIELMGRYPGKVFACVGAHPVDEGRRVPVSELRDLAATPGVVAIGEAGLDKFHTPYDLEDQKTRFIEQIELANELKLPLIIHTREAFTETLEILDAHKLGFGFVVHCFSGSVAEADEILQRGGHISFTGLITYPKNREMADVLKFVPLDRLMIETDSPYLAPQKRRGQVCEPMDVRAVAEFLAEVRGISFEEVAEATTETAKRFFNLEV